MPRTQYGPQYDPTTVSVGVDGASQGGAALEVRCPDGSPSIPDDVMELLSPLLMSLSRAVDGAAVAIILPRSLIGGSSEGAGPAVLCALQPELSLRGLGELIAEASTEIHRSASSMADGAQLPLYLPIPSLSGFQRAGVPVWAISLDGEDSAALLLMDGADGPISPRRASLVDGFARAIAAGLKAILRQRRRERASGALLEVVRTAGSTLQLEEVLSLVTENTGRLVGADRCSLWLLDKDGSTLLPSALSGMSPDFVRQWKQYPLSLESEPLSKEAIETGKPVLVANAADDPRTDKDAVRFFGDKTILVLPVVAKGQVQGTLYINHVTEHHRYSMEEIETAMAIANQAAIAIQNARLYREVEEWNSQLERLQAIMSKLSRSKSVSSIANIVADELRNLIRYDNCRVFVLQEDTNELVPLAVVSSSRDYWIERMEDLQIQVGQGVTGWVAQHGVPQIVGDVERDPRAYHVPGTPVLDESMIAAPINFEGRVIGVITLSRLGLNQFTVDELRLLDVFANEAAIEFENARLYQETQKKSRELLASFHRVGDALATGLEPNQTLQIIVDLAAEMVKAKGCALMLLDEGSGELVFRAARGLPVDVGQVDRAQAGRGVSWQVVKEGAPRLISDLAAVERPSWLRQGAEELRSYLGVPLTMQGQVAGVLSVFGNRVDQFSQADVELLSSFAHQAAIAIRNASLFTSLQERVRELTGLAEVSRSIAKLTDLDDTYRELTKSIAQLLQAESCMLLLLGEDGRLLPQHPAFGFSQEELEEVKLRIVDRASSSATKGCPIRSVDGLQVACDGEWRRQPALLAPLRAQDRLIGAVLVSERPGSRFNENDLRLLTILSTNAAVIVQNAILYQSVDRERDELDAIISNTSDAIIIFDQEKRVIRINAAAEALTSWRSDEVVGRSCVETLFCLPGDPGRRKPAVSMLDVIDKREPSPYFETVIVTKDGLERDVAASYSFVRSATRGESLGVVIARDISKLREVDRMKSDFVSMVSHELRTPLGLIKGYASTLLNPQLSLDQPTVQRFLMGIDGAADRLARLIENVLNVSRIESGLLKISPQQVDLTHLVSVAVSTARASSKGREIQLHAPRRAIKVEGDRVQLELVLDNLLGNAIKYSPMEKPIRVELRKRPTEAEIRVIDQGIGIAAQHLPRVFDKFYRVEGGQSRRTPGSGLGLYICRNIIEAHGGRIWAESRLGEGSTFVVVLPLRQREGSERAADREAGQGVEEVVADE